DSCRPHTRRARAAPPLEDDDRCCGRALKCAGRAAHPEKGRSIVEPTAVSPFAAWENFYVIVGSSAAALTGLQFVVVVLGAEARSIGPEVGAVVLQRDPPRTLLVIGATALFLLFIGIHNAWDAVTYIATQQPQHEERARDRK